MEATSCQSHASPSNVKCYTTIFHQQWIACSMHLKAVQWRLHVATIVTPDLESQNSPWGFIHQSCRIRDEHRKWLNVSRIFCVFPRFHNAVLVWNPGQTWKNWNFSCLSQTPHFLSIIVSKINMQKILTIAWKMAKFWSLHVYPRIHNIYFGQIMGWT